MAGKLASLPPTLYCCKYVSTNVLCRVLTSKEAYTPIYKVDIQKQYQNTYWTNVYYVNQPDLASASAAATTIVNVERTIHAPAVNFDKVRVSDLSSTQYQTISVNQPGQRSVTGDFLPLFNVLRVDFNVAGGRPSRKYLRLPVAESDQSNGIFTSSALQSLATGYAIPTSTGICDESGSPFTSTSFQERVGMRQLRRGSRRRTTPVI